RCLARRAPRPAADGRGGTGPQMGRLAGCGSAHLDAAVKCSGTVRCERSEPRRVGHKRLGPRKDVAASDSRPPFEARLRRAPQDDGAIAALAASYSSSLRYLFIASSTFGGWFIISSKALLTSAAGM